MPPTLKSLRRRAKDNTLEVEHILEAAALRLDGLPQLLEELSIAQGWSDDAYLSDGRHVVPRARWASVASAYCNDGLEGLRRLLDTPGQERFILGLLEELHSREAVHAIMDFFPDCMETPGDNLEVAHKIASSLNLMLCFKPQVEISAGIEKRVRAFATKLIALAGNQAERATAVLLLRAVGDESSLEQLDALPPFADAWESTIPSTKRAIRKRLKARKR